MEKRGIIVVSSGASDEEVIKKSIGAIEDRIANYFGNWEVKRAFTSENIIRKIRNSSNIKVDTVEESIIKMLEEGFTRIIVQPLHIIPGSEYEKTVESVRKYKDKFREIKLGRPLLYHDGDIKEAIEAMKNQIPIMNKDEAVVLVGHGTKHNSNIYYKRLQEEIYNQRLKIYIATLGEYPSIHDIIPEMKRNNIKNITLMPYMLVCGTHGKTDIAGDKEDSCKSVLEKGGFKIKLYMHGIGENEKYQEIYLEHLKDAMDA